MSKQFKFISDPRHGWLEVTHKDLLDLNVADKITGCSYIDSKHVYLEEDLDAGIFIKAFCEKNGLDFSEFNDMVDCRNVNKTKIRDLESFKVELLSIERGL